MKKVFGFVFIAIGIFLGLGFVVQIPTAIMLIRQLFSGTSYEIGFSLGNLAFLLILATVVYFLLKYGLKWIKKSPENPA